MRYRWVILAAGTSAQAAFSAVFFGTSVLAPALREQYDLSLPQVGLLLAAVSIGATFSVLPWGLLADRVGERAVIATGLTAAGAVLVVSGRTGSFDVLVALLVLSGLFGASVNAASGRAVMHWFRPHERGLALGIRQTSVTIGGAIAAAVLPVVERAGGTAWALATLGFGCLAAAITAAVLLREGPRSAPEVAGHALDPLRDSRLWQLAGGSALLLAPQVCLIGFLVVFLHDRRGWSAATAAALLVVLQVFGAVSRVLAGRWSDVVRSRIVPLRAIALALAVAVGATAAVVSAPIAALVAVLVAAGTLSMSWNGLSFTATAELAGYARSGAALGFQQTVLFVVGALLPIPFAALVASTSWQAGFALLALAPLAAWGTLGAVRETAWVARPAGSSPR
jgi:sugar phosphate permease